MLAWRHERQVAPRPQGREPPNFESTAISCYPCSVLLFWLSLVGYVVTFTIASVPFSFFFCNLAFVSISSGGSV
jgi:hypothetical protein